MYNVYYIKYNVVFRFALRSHKHRPDGRSCIKNLPIYRYLIRNIINGYDLSITIIQEY